MISDSLRLSDSSFSTRLSEVGPGDATYSMGNVSSASGPASPERSQPNSQAVVDPSNSSSLPNAFPSETKAVEASTTTAASPVDAGSSASTLVTAAPKKVGATSSSTATKSQSDVNHNTSNGCLTPPPPPTGSTLTPEEGHQPQWKPLKALEKQRNCLCILFTVVQYRYKCLFDVSNIDIVWQKYPPP